MLSKNDCKFLNQGIQKSITEYLPSERRLLLLDILYFLSIKTQRMQPCTKADITTINALYDLCKETKKDPLIYVSCAYDYVGKYITQGHKVPVSYLLSDKVVDFVSKKINATSSCDNLISSQIKNDIITTEKQIRAYSNDLNVPYLKALIEFFNLGRVSNIFLLYKVYMGQEPIASIKLSDDMSKFYSVLEPIFIGLSSRHGQYSAVNSKNWSNSKIETFSFCPIFFKDRYLNDDIPPKYLGNEASETGSNVHSMFEDVIKNYNKAKKKDMSAVFSRYLKSKKFLEIKDSLQEHLPGFVEFFTNPESILLKNLNGHTELLTEKKLALTLDGGNVNFSGIVDLIIVNGNDAIILDYKTSKIDNAFWLEKNNEKYHMQLSLYAYFVENLLQKTISKIGIVYTRGLLKEYDSVDQNIMQQRLDEITTIKSAIKLNSFKANTKSCKLCRHPNCRYRTNESMWDDEGKRKVVN